MAPLDRRTLLRRVGAGASAAAVGALAGCGTLGDGDRGRGTTFDVPDRTTTTTRRTTATTDRRTPTTDPASVVDFGPVSVPEHGDPTYRRWLPAPGELSAPGDDRSGFEDSYPVRHVDLDRIRGVEGGVPPVADRLARLFTKPGLDHFGVGFESFRRVVRFPGGTVVEADLDRTAVAGTLRETGYDDAGDHRGHDLFGRSDDPRAVAVGDDVLVFASVGGTDARLAVAIARTVVDAGAGAVTRYHEADDAFDRIVRASGDAPLALLDASTDPLTVGVRVDLDGLAGYGWTNAFDADTTYHRHVVSFDRPQDPDRLREKLRLVAASSRMREARGVEVTVGEEWAQVAAAFPDGSLDDDRPEVTYPQVTWSFDHDRADGLEVTVTHEAGDEVPAETLELKVRPGFRTIATFEEHDVVGPGDSVTATVPDEDPDEVLLGWSAPGTSSTLGTYEFG